MVLHRPASTYGCSYRDLRRALVVATAIAVILFAACAPAFAGEPAASGAEVAEGADAADTTALARVAISESRFDDALRVLARVKVAATSDAERAAASEMSSVVERWVALRRVVFPRVRGTPRGEREAADGGATDVSTGTDWESGFAIARAQLIAGDFDLAAPNFAALQVGARDGHRAQRARALGALARELAIKGLVLGWTEPRVAPAAQHAPDWHRDPRAQKTRWYGWQTLMADGVSVLVLPVLATAIDKNGDGDRVALAVVSSYVLAPGVIHLFHGRPGAAAASVGLRIGMPLTGAFLGLAASKGNCHGEFCGLDGAVVGFALGAIGASAIDAAALSRETVDDETKPKAAAAPQKGVAITPLGGPRREGGFDVGVGAVF